MRAICLGVSFLALWGTPFFPAQLSAQQVTIATPYNTVSEGFFEHMGMSWGLRGKNWNFSFGGSPMQAPPQFGGFDPSAGANFGWGGPNGHFAANWSQGNRRTFTTQVPSVTVMNGGMGGVYDISQSPFVMGVVPVVGGFPMMGAYRPVNPALATAPIPGASNVGYEAVRNALNKARAERERLERLDDQNIQPAGNLLAEPSADDPVALNVRPRHTQNTHEDLVLIGSDFPTDNPAQAPVDAFPPLDRNMPGDAGIPTEGRRQASAAVRPVSKVPNGGQFKAQEEKSLNPEALTYINRARSAETEGNASTARVYYQMAARRASGELKNRILARIDALAE